MAALILLSSLPFVRRFAYEAFINSHLALTILAAIALWEHLKLKKRFSRVLFLIASGVFVLTSSAQYLHQMYYNIGWRRSISQLDRPSGLQFVRVRWTRQFGDSLVIELELSRPWMPGQHIFLRFQRGNTPLFSSAILSWSLGGRLGLEDPRPCLSMSSFDSDTDGQGVF